MRLFYLTYPISQTVSAKLDTTKSETLSRILQTPHFHLTWSHYLVLLAIRDNQERSFYEIETSQNSWSVRELKRQYNSGLYMRLALSTNKEGVKQLAKQGQVIEKPIDAIKDPYVLEFLDLPEKYQYSETDLENALIDKLEHFLLELGKGFTFVARQKRITFAEKHFYMDLVFYNRLLKCFVIFLGAISNKYIARTVKRGNYRQPQTKMKQKISLRPTEGNLAYFLFEYFSVNQFLK